MEFGKLVFLVSVLLPIIFAKCAWVDPALLSEDTIDLQDQNSAVSQSKAAKLQLHQLKSKIAYLETSIENRTGELERKDGGIKQLEKVIEEKSNSLASLQSAIRSLQEKVSLEVKKRLGEVNARVNELEKQIVNLKNEIEAQNNKKDQVEAQANAAEEKIKGLNLKLQNLQRINEEQKSRIRKAQHALQVAEEEMLKARLEASSITKQLKKVHQAWLPPWLSAHLVHCKSFVLTQWDELGRPSLDLIIQKALKQKSEVEKSLQPHLETMRTSLTTKAIEYYHVARSTIYPHMVKMQDFVDPYLQETKMFMKPYIDQVSETTKPHLEKACLLLKPYSKNVVHYQKIITKNARIYHSQIQATLHDTFNTYELTKPLATGGLVRVMASILMALPLILLYRILIPKFLSTIVYFQIMKEPKKRCHISNRSHARRRAKRVHQNK